ncbi:MAG TPA: response regulator transcription factor [Magnetovibrio sp.]
MDIILADDHALVREGLIPFLEELADEVSVIEAESFDRALMASKSSSNLQLIILDLGMPGMDGLAGVRKMMEANPDVPVVILSGTHDQSLILKAFNLGIAGFIPKSAGSLVMVSALNLVMAGERFMPSNLLMENEIPQTHTPITTDTKAQTLDAQVLHNLSKRERMVLEFIIGGMTNKEIARTIELQEATVKIHVKNIYRKMGVANRAQAVRTAIQPGWSRGSDDHMN